MEVIYTAAHAHFPDTEPLGGGKAVADYLCQKQPNWTVLSPHSLGLLPAEHITSTERSSRRGSNLHEMSEIEYAQFCRRFERATTAEILQRDPSKCVVLTNDISEGPDFAMLGAKNYRLASIWHVDVVEYFTKFYLRGWIRPETAARIFPWPGLVFRKQRDCVRHSVRIIVPSEPMRNTIQRCYPWCSAEKIAVIPWGNLSAEHASGKLTPSAGQQKADPVLSSDEFVIITLSRLSPEKGIERLLKALPHLSASAYRVLICGAAAYMKGRRYERRLRRLARGLPVDFLGHVTGERKAAILQRADLFVSPSRHESYGLTIAEAMAAGCPIISHNHYGAAGKVVDCGDRRALAAVLEEAIRQGRKRRIPSRSLPDAAVQISELLNNIAVEPAGCDLAIRANHR